MILFWSNEKLTISVQVLSICTHARCQLLCSVVDGCIS